MAALQVSGFRPIAIGHEIVTPTNKTNSQTFTITLKTFRTGFLVKKLTKTKRLPELLTPSKAFLENVHFVINPVFAMKSSNLIIKPTLLFTFLKTRDLSG